jgi:hypothetical protein
MNSAELGCIAHCILKDNPAHLQFVGVFARNQINGFVRQCKPSFYYPCCAILNTDDNKGPGEHWVAALFRSAYELEFFDSYAFTPTIYDFSFARSFTIITCSPYQLQADASDYCGHYCLYYLYQRSRNMSLDHVYYRSHMFTPSTLSANDSVVRRFIKLLKKRCPSASSHSREHLVYCSQSCICKSNVCHCN